MAVRTTGTVVATGTARTVRHRRTLAGTAAAAALTALTLAAPHHAAAAPAPSPTAAAAGATASANHNAAEFWTLDRMAAAEPVKLPELSLDELKEAAADLTGSSTAPPISAKPTLPKETAAGGKSSPAVGPMAVNDAQRWLRQGSMPARTTGKLYFVTDNGGLGSCSASVITAANKNTVWTAGHCIHPGGTGAGGYYDVDRMAFVPDHDDGAEPYGRWDVTYVNTTVGWQDEEDFENDVAAIEVVPRSAALQDTVGSQGYRFGYGQDFSDATVLGYPAAGNGRDFPDDQLFYCQDNTEDASIWGWDERLQIVCDMGAGASGGPWLDDLDTTTGGGYIVGSSSHNYDPDPNDDDNGWPDQHLYSSNHGDGAINVYNDVSNH